LQQDDIMEQLLLDLFSKYPAGKKEGLIPILQEIQEEKGSLTGEILTAVAQHLELPVNKVYGVAAFYNQFLFRPHGAFHIQVCDGTGCHLGGSVSLLTAVEKFLKIKAGNTSRDGQFSLEAVPCMGACDQSPVISINGERYPRINEEELRKIIGVIKEKKV